MSIHSYIHLFFLISTFLLSVNARNSTQEYVILKDFFNFIRAAEFTVYDINEKQIYYRIESQISLLQNVKLIVYPSKQVIGRLRAKLSAFTYKGEFSVWDSQSNQWINGTIKENFSLTKDLFNINWGRINITMGKENGTKTSIFRDSNRKILAEYRLRSNTSWWTHKYDMKIFSNTYPEQIYLLALTTRHRFKRPRNG